MEQIPLPFKKRWIFDCPDCEEVFEYNLKDKYLKCPTCNFNWFVPYLKDAGHLYVS